jgi:molybdate transport system substrate-binding protein
MTSAMRWLRGVGLGVVVSCAVASGSAGAAGEIRVMTSGAFASALAALGPQFEQATKDKVVTVTTSTGVGADAIPNRIRRGDAVDVVILPEAALDAVIKDRLVLPGTVIILARSSIGMAVRAGAPKPDISSVEALRRTLLQAGSVAYSASVSGDYLTKELFPRLNVVDRLKASGKRIEVERVGAVVARGEAEIGFQQISELLEVPGVDLVGPLPAEVQRVTAIAAGVAASSNNPTGARELIGFFASPEAASTIRKVGLEPIPRQ